MKRAASLVLALIIGFCFTLDAQAAWKNYKSDKYRLKMKYPGKMELKEQDAGEWSGVVGLEKKSNTILAAYNFMGAKSKDDMRAFAAKASKIPAEAWKLQDSAEGKAGFEWYEIYLAQSPDLAVYCLLGKNKREDRSYVIYIGAPIASFKKWSKAFKRWFQSIEAF